MSVATKIIKEYGLPLRIKTSNQFVIEDNWGNELLSTTDPAITQGILIMIEDHIHTTSISACNLSREFGGPEGPLDVIVKIKPNTLQFGYSIEP